MGELYDLTAIAAIWLCFWVLCGAICGGIASGKGRCEWGWFFGGLFFGPVGVLIVALLPKVE